jgi:hypothetical protein
MKRRRKYGRRRRRQVIIKYRQNGSLEKTAAAVGCSRSFAYKVLVDAGEIVNHPPVFTTKVVRDAIALYGSGLSARATVVELNKTHNPPPSQQWVFERVREAGIARSHARANEIREMQRLGKDFDLIRRIARRIATEKLWSAKMIARHLGVSTKTITRALPPGLRCDASLATQRRKWQAYLPDVDRRRALRDDVIALRLRKTTIAAIVSTTGLSKSTVCLYLKRAGLTKPIRSALCLRHGDAKGPRGSRQLYKTLWAEAAQLRAAGKTYSSIHVITGLSIGALSRRLGTPRVGERP